MLSKQEKETLLGLMERLSVTPEEKEHADALWKNASAWEKIWRAIEYPYLYAWRRARYWRAAWRATGERPREMLRWDFPTLVCLQVRVIVGLFQPE